LDWRKRLSLNEKKNSFEIFFFEMKLICSFLVISVALFNNSVASPVPQEDGDYFIEF